MIELAWIVAATVAQASPPSSTAATPPVDAPAAAVKFAKPRLLTSGFGAEPRWPLVADLDGDGFGDLIAVDPAAGIVDVARSVRGGKFLGPVNAASEPGPVTSATQPTVRVAPTAPTALPIQSPTPLPRPTPRVAADA